MALALKSATLAKPFSYISLHDGALDTSAGSKEFAEEFEKYRQGAIPLPPIKEGEAPTVWELQPIAQAEVLSKLRGKGQRFGSSFQALAAARLGLKGVENLVDPATGEPMEIEIARDAEGRDSITQKTENIIGLDILEELGLVILSHATPNPT